MDDLPAVFVRRSEFDDHPAILALIGDEAHILNKRFGRFDVTYMIENATLGITAVDGEGKVIGYAAFFDYPALTPSVDQATWPEWLEETHGHPEFTPQNSLWLAFFVADHLFEAEVSENIMRTAFTTLPEIDAFLLALPPDQRLFAPMRQSFEFLAPLDGAPEQPCKLHACPRGLYVPNLLIRTARVEDHDDLVPLFDQQSEVLSGRYGEFFLADVIAAQDAKSQALAAEAEGHAVGLMALTSDIDVRLLERFFELDAFDGLQKPGAHGAPPPPAAKQGTLRARKEAGSRAEAGGEEAGADDKGADGGEGDGDGEEAVEEEQAEEEEAAADRHGWKCNAFAITLFCMDESFESRAVDFLRPAFALFPELDYMIVTLPHITAEFGLLSHFTRIHTRAHDSAGAGGAGDARFGHVLYIMHRAALVGQISVREASPSDLPGARALCAGLDGEEALLHAAQETAHALAAHPRSAEHRPKTVAFVIECQAQVVGIATVLEQGVDVDGLKRHYCLEDYILLSEHSSAAGHARLEQLVINPLFSSSVRFVLKELFRKARRSVLYLELRHDGPVPDVASQFVEVRPRRQIQLPPHLAEAARAERVARGGSEAAPDCALHFLTRKLITEPKIQNNVRIVVVGASDTSVAFLETLLAVPYLFFSSITLVAPDGLPDGSVVPPASALTAASAGKIGGAAPVEDPPVPPNAFTASSLCYTNRELRQLALTARVKVVRASVADIDRVRKAVELAGPNGESTGERVPYDVLLLAPLLHDQTLANISESVRGVGGAFSVSGGQVERDVDDFLRSSAWARRSKLSDCSAVVYGGTLSAYCCLQALLERGVDADQLCLILPPGAHTPFADPRVETRVRDALDELGIAVLESLALRDVHAGIDGSISSIVLSDGDEQQEREIPCALLLTADVPDVDDAIFRACNSNSLVYDGRLVIDARFRTSDASIYAAGPLTKFARRYRGGLNLENYNKRDVGIKVAHSLLPLLDPLSAGAAHVAGNADALPTFSQPRGEGGMLPGRLLYVHVQRPAKPLPYEELIRLGKVGRELTTVANGTDYCCFRIDPYDLIDAITYLGKAPIEVTNVKQLIGLPQMYCNRLVPRYDEGLIPDLPQFLRDNWAMCLFHDRFGDFRSALKGELLEEEAFAAIAADLQERLEMGIELPSKEELRAAVQASSKQLVEKRLIEYLQTNQNHLSMYLVPSAQVMRQMEDADLINGPNTLAQHSSAENGVSTA